MPNDPARLYRHPSDVARLVFWLGVLGVLLMLAVLRDGEIASISTKILALFDALPAALENGLVGLVQMLATLVPIIAVFVLYRSRRWQLSLLMVLASVIAAIAMPLLTEFVEESVPRDLLGYAQVESWFIGSQYPSATYLAILDGVARYCLPLDDPTVATHRLGVRRLCYGCPDPVIH